WLAAGNKVSEVVHEFITSIYTKDPDGNMVEFTCNTHALTEQDREEAERLLLDDSPASDPDYPGVIYLPDGRVIEAPSSPSSTVVPSGRTIHTVRPRAPPTIASVWMPTSLRRRMSGVSMRWLIPPKGMTTSNGVTRWTRCPRLASASATNAPSFAPSAS